MTNKDWSLKLFNKSVHKQRKWKEIVAFLGDATGLKCMDIGADNGVISYLLRQRGGNWVSADLDDIAVMSIRSLVDTEVYQIDGSKIPFHNNEFDKIVIVDFLEHIPNDAEFLEEIYRIMKPEGELIINVPHLKQSLLRKFRYWIGQTDEKHGHLRPGYTVSHMAELLENKFNIICYKTYSRFYSELIDTLITWGYGLLQKNKNHENQNQASKGVLITESDMKKFKKSFRLYSIMYPFVWLFVKLDALLFFQSGYLLMLKVKVNNTGAMKTVVLKK